MHFDPGKGSRRGASYGRNTSPIVDVDKKKRKGERRGKIVAVSVTIHADN